jgi:hypothetical protein
MRESSKVRSILERMKQRLPSDSTETAQEFASIFDELVTTLKSLGQFSGLTRTDNAGRFNMEQLRPGERYVVLAIDWDKGDSDEVAYYRHIQTEPLKEGSTVLGIHMGPGRKSTVRATSKSE